MYEIRQESTHAGRIRMWMGLYNVPVNLEVKFCTEIIAVVIELNLYIVIHVCMWETYTKHLSCMLEAYT